MTENVTYSQKAPKVANAKFRTKLFMVLTAVYAVMLVIVSRLPYNGILTLLVFLAGAYFMHKFMKETIFDTTYALYEDRLVYIRKYGRLEWECEVFPFDEAKFYADKIEHRGKTYEFYPDDKLMEFLGI